MIWSILRRLHEYCIWNFRLWWANYPVPMDLNGWLPERPRDFGKVFEAWQFLKPFFLSRGYLLYCYEPTDGTQFFRPDPASNKPPALPGYPFARYMCSDDSQASLFLSVPTVCAARDFQGRDVIIKIVSDSAETNELKVLRALNSAKLREDPRNHTIAVLDFITFRGLTFVAMPRWPPAFDPDFGTVQEIMDIADVVFETLDFLHENRIAHGDLLAQNMGINAITDTNLEYPQCMRDPSAVMYAIYDFGGSLMYPADTVLHDVREKPTPRRWATQEYNPFEEDLAYTSNTLGRFLRLLGHVAPDLITLLDKLKTQGPEYAFTAHMALIEFRAIKATLSQDVLSQPVTDRWWSRATGTITTKAQRPTRLIDIDN